MKTQNWAFTLIRAKRNRRPCVVRLYGHLRTGMWTKQGIPPTHLTTKDIRFTPVFPYFFFFNQTIFWISLVKWKAISIFWFIFKGFFLSNSRQFHFSVLFLKVFAYISIAISPPQTITHPNHYVPKSCCFDRTSLYRLTGRERINFLAGEKKYYVIFG